MIHGKIDVTNYAGRSFVNAVVVAQRGATPLLMTPPPLPPSTGQGRLDGAFCDYTEQEKLDFLKKIHAEGIINMEMESLMFAALSHHAGIRGAVVCVTLLDRLKGDQVRLKAL